MNSQKKLICKEGLPFVGRTIVRQSLFLKKLRIVFLVRSLVSVLLIGTPFSSVGISVSADSKYSLAETFLFLTSLISRTKSLSSQRKFGAYWESSYSDLRLIHLESILFIMEVVIFWNLIKCCIQICVKMTCDTNLFDCKYIYSDYRILISKPTKELRNKMGLISFK